MCEKMDFLNKLVIENTYYIEDHKDSILYLQALRHSSCIK